MWSDFKAFIMRGNVLDLAIAFIIALIAALVGPYFIDWNQSRPQFEAEATRIVEHEAATAAEVQHEHAFIETILNLIPSNIFAAMARGGAAGTSANPT